MLKKTLALVSFVLSISVSAEYYDIDQDLTYSRTDEISTPSWRIANHIDIANLLGLTYFDGYADVTGAYNQKYVDVILGLGGSMSNDFIAGMSTCSPLIDCEAVIAFCTDNPDSPVCDGQGSGSVNLNGVYISLDDYYEAPYKQELWFDYSFVNAGSWHLEILGPAAELGDYCDIDGNSFCDLPGLVVSEVPVPAAVWLFSSALIGLAGMKRKK